MWIRGQLCTRMRNSIEVLTLAFLVRKTTADVYVTRSAFTNHSHVHYGAVEVIHNYGPVWIRGNVIKRPPGGGGIWVSTRAYG